jgi:hypothetical protein
MDSSTQISPTVTAIYNQLKSWTDGTQELNAGSIILLVPQVIALVQKEVPGENRGTYKKIVALSVIKLIVKDSTLDDESKRTLSMLIDDVLSPMIDVMISIAKHEIEMFKTGGTKGCYERWKCF